MLHRYDTFFLLYIPITYDTKRSSYKCLLLNKSLSKFGKDNFWDIHYLHFESITLQCILC